MIRTRAVLAGLLAAALLAGCSTTGTTGASTPAPSGDADFPVTITGALGSATITARPQRVATVAWANHDAVLALGVVPVGMAKANYGDDDSDGIHPWTKEALGELGATTPVLFDETDGVDPEAVNETHPDVIIAAYSGLTAEEYSTLSEIAPTVGYPKTAWGTTWDQTVALTGQALGLESKATAFVTDTRAAMAAEVAKHPSLAGKTVMFAFFSPTDLSTIGFYTPADARPAYLTDLGLVTAPSVVKLSATTDQFYTTVSSEQADLFNDVDIVVTYGTPAQLVALQQNPLIGKIPAIERGSVALLTDGTPLAASAGPTALSIRWSLTDYVNLLAAAADKVA